MHRPSYLHNLIAQHVVLGILNKVFLGTPSIGCCTQKQAPEVYNKAVLKNFAILTGKHVCLQYRSNNVAALKACTFIKKRLQQRYFLVNVEKFLRKLILKTSANRCFCVSPLFHLLLFSEFIQNYYFMFQLSLVCDIMFCVISADNKI